MKTTIDTTRFENTHGRKPKGRGLWFLELTIGDGRGSWTSETFSFTGTLSEAKAAAKQHVRSTIGAARELLIEVGT